MRLDDQDTCASWLNSLKIDDWGVCTFVYKGETIIVEPFDKPFVAQQVHMNSNGLEVWLPYTVKKIVNPETLCLDSWDRFHGLTKDGIPFVLTSKAQAELFSLASGFTDDSISFGGQTIETEDFYQKNDAVNDSDFWNQKYEDTPTPKWDLEAPHPGLESILPQLKLLKGRFLVPGCGRGHDAHLLAKKGHIVEAVDFSAQALEKAKALYGDTPNLTFSQGDILQWAQNNKESYDFIFEHTCFCAINPERRKDLIKTWFQSLDDGGHLLGLFFIKPNRGGPPFGASEWELKKLLEPYFNLRYWTRSQVSPGWRKGIELIVYAEKKRDR